MSTSPYAAGKALKDLRAPGIESAKISVVNVVLAIVFILALALSVP